VKGHFKRLGIAVQARAVRRLLSLDRNLAVLRRQRIVRRREYDNPFANLLWHSDGCHHLIRFGLVLHGCIDGHSRKIMWMHFADNNRAATVGALHRAAIMRFGVPTLHRTDHGTENGEIWALLAHMRSLGYRVRAVQGQSVHNVKIERLWRDLRAVTNKLRSMLMAWEREGILSAANKHELLAVQHVMLPYANELVAVWVAGWDEHKVRTFRCTPNQRFADSMEDRKDFVQWVNVVDEQVAPPVVLAAGVEEQYLFTLSDFRTSWEAWA
jgi:hypothetical protein